MVYRARPPFTSSPSPSTRSRWSSLSLLAMLAVAAGCGSGGGKGAKPGGTGGAAGMVVGLHIVSMPVKNAQVGTTLKYQAALSEPGAAVWSLDAGPGGAKIDQGGNLTWTPTDAQGGAQTFTVSATNNGKTAHQTFTVTVAHPVVQTSAMVDPQDPNGATISVDAPLSSVRGTALQIEPGALPPGGSVSVTISSVENAPLPASALAAGVSATDLKPVELGPSGLTFTRPVKLQLPIAPGLLSQTNLAVQTYDYAAGKWEKVKLLSIDREASVAVAEVQHFSTYLVAPDVRVLDLATNLGPGGTACSGALMVRATLVPKFADIPASAVNGSDPSAAGSVGDLLGAIAPGQALQVLTHISARATAATGTQDHWLLATAAKLPDGTFKVTVVSDAQSGPFLSTPPALAAGDPELLAWMNGSRADLVFGALGPLDGGALVNGDVSLYLVPAADADRPPPASANALGTEQATATTLAPLMGFDDDCDGAPNSWDPQPQGTAPPVLSGVPAGPVHVSVGSPAIFKVSSPQTGVTFTWSASDPTVTLISGVGGTVGTATPSVPGLFHVWVTGAAGGATARFAWDLIADPPEVAMANTPPAVAISASANVVRAGDPVVLTAIGKDAEQSSLTYGWTSVDATTLSAQLGATVVFVATRTGDYQITCVANDGLVSSAPATVTLTVVSPTANRAPGTPSVTPISATLTHAAGATASLVLNASAVDPDGDMLTYDFVPGPTTPSTFTLARSGATAQFSSAQDGVYVFYVTATDPNGAQSPWTPVKILVAPQQPPMMVAVDADRDGYPAGFDCNDADPAIHPGAKEICGDGVDQDCDGRDLGVAECDRDGDRFTPAQGDCDDNNPAIGPQMIERCDGIDNNCNGQIDESFAVGADCAIGVGACQVTAHTVCSASFGGVVCGGVPRAATPEICDGVDNDCNGQIDDIPGQSGGDVANCGGCGIACVAAPNSQVACVKGGCLSSCAAGYVDTDRNPANGCECQITNGGVEVCDGIDNDCNGAIDEGVGSLVYGGPAGTQGIGVCAAGLQVCQGGKMVDARPARLPSPEICDGLDNDCNGKVDDGFDLMNDARNCGGCGMACALNQMCLMGKCIGGSTGTGGTGGAPDGGMTTGGGGSGGGTPDGGTTTGGGGGTGSGGPILSVCSSASGAALCTDLGQDPANCGACGHTCASGQVCMNGACVVASGTSCPAPGIACTDPANPTKVYCTNPASDPANCGACGHSCASGMTCVAAMCVSGSTSCPAPSAICPAPGGAGTFCADLTSDPANCGGCGKVCPAGAACQMGVCGGGGGTMTCPAATPMACPMSGGGIYCTDPKSDAANCGGCGRTCPAGVACVNGACGGTGCPATAPNGCLSPAGMPYCTNLSSDPSNCGGCGIVCPAGAVCQAGMCGGGGTTCPPSQPKTCPGPQGPICTDMISDPMNCGNCGIVCPAGAACVNGSCGGGTAVSCTGATPNGCFVAAGEICTNLLNDGANCGRCGAMCAMGVACVGGVCGGTMPGGCPATASAMCPSPTGGSYCADLTIDPANCGACGRACPSGVACQMGMCGGGGTTMCAPPAPNACPKTGGGSFCTDLSRDAGNCGTCGHACGAGMICMAAMCVAGSGTTCAPPQITCLGPDGVSTFCTDPNSDPANCGGCGKVCPAGVACQMGVCGSGGTMTCPVAMPMACPMAGGGIYCTDPKSDAANCGGCGKTCPAGVACVNGACGGSTGCPATAPNGCTSPTGMPYCTSLSGDPANCGACGQVCPAGVACQNGMCGGSGMTCPAAQPKTCPGPQGPICTDMITDPNNCGNCGIVCPAGAACVNGSCGGGTSMSCGGATPNACFLAGMEICTNVLNDGGNCGRCGTMCPAGVACVGGVCGGTMPGGCPATASAMCPSATGGSYCADLSTDAANCGACGRACPSGVACLQAICGGGGTTMCVPPTPNACPSAAGGSFCTDLTRDAGNCGACGHLCASGTICMGATCVPGSTTCASPQALCPVQGGTSTFCADLMRDPANCGACGKVCPAGVACQNGACGGGPVTCAAPAQACTDKASGQTYCTDTTRDPGNCGACGNTCPTNAICTAGTCQGGGGAYPGLAACPGTGGAPMCTNLFSDAANCGACGTVCASGQGCYGGQCSSGPTCPPDAKICTDPTGTKMYCANVLYDSGNCGACGVVCAAGNACQNGTCAPVMTPDGGAGGSGGITCPAPMIPCGDPTKGMYCADPAKDPANCGGCGIVCPATMACVQGKCG